MKYRMLALILALTVVSWAQTATQTTPSTPQTPETKCACCDKMAASDSKDAHAACLGKHDGKEMASCCAGKDDKSCCGGKDDKSCMKDGKMADCCKGKDGMKCDRKAGKDCGKGCCGSSKSEKPA
jgi:hypothetical protein